MSQIRVLPQILVNKIAAGEVIERPASAVKELLENAVDAGATRIDVAVEDGGKGLIQATDNGGGMSREDLGLAFAQHATSKLDQEEDLFAIRTMGFRGEALASIGSVSRARVVSRTAEGQGGYEVAIDGGQQSEVKPTAAPVGTTVQIRDLFFNVPARRKFLRSTNTEMAHITEQLTKVALANSEIHFTLSHNGRKNLELPVSIGLRERIAGLFGEELAQTLIEANSAERGIGIRALLAPPGMSRTSGKWQYFFLNGRYIRDRLLSHALREAYRGLMEASRFPVAFVYLQMDPETVDVNVHPTKVEVRFREANTVHSQVLGTLREQFLKSDLAGAVHIENRPDHDQQQRVRQAVADYMKSQPVNQERLSFAGRGQGGYVGGSEQTSQTPPLSGAGLREELNKLFEQDRETASADGQAGPRHFGRTLQIHRTYIVSETPDGMIIVDQHALHERILYEKLKTRLAEGKLESQQLLVPMPVELSNQQQAVLSRAKEVLGQVGIDVVDFGPKSIAVQSFPAMLGKADPAAVVQDIMDRLTEVSADVSGEQLLEPVLASMSCKAAVKAGDELKEEEMRQLLADRHLANMSSSCPHGRPTILNMSLAELEKQFKRT